MHDPPPSRPRGPSQPRFRARSERIQAGKALRRRLPREQQGQGPAPGEPRDPIALLEASNQDRLPELIPIRYGRMLRSPFTFLRGAAALMAHDLAAMPTTGVTVQACGDCHLLNFGLFATPERHLVFDLNDFDETHPAPWEWDLKRLVSSIVVGGRDFELSDDDCRDSVLACSRAYREHLRAYSRLSLIATAPDERAKQRRRDLAEKARSRVIDHLFPRITTSVGGPPRLLDQPPVLFHPAVEDFDQLVQEGLEDYRLTLSEERRVLFDRYRFEDAALKVVGIGSVGTR